METHTLEGAFAEKLFHSPADFVGTKIADHDGFDTIWQPTGVSKSSYPEAGAFAYQVSLFPAAYKFCI